MCSTATTEDCSWSAHFDNAEFDGDALVAAQHLEHLVDSQRPRRNSEHFVQDVARLQHALNHNRPLTLRKVFELLSEAYPVLCNTAFLHTDDNGALVHVPESIQT